MAHVVDQESLAIAISHGEGCYLFDADGKKYLDFVGGWCVGSIGWGHPAIRKALEKEAKRATYIPPYLKNPDWEPFAKILTQIAPGKMGKVFPVTSGSEAVDMAIKCARAATKRDTIISIKGVYHGQTYGSASVGEAHERITGPSVSGFVHLPMPGKDEGAESVLKKLEERLAKNDVAAFLSEPVWSNAGVYIPPEDFYPEVARLCKKHGALLVMDEVATGFGHCGTLFASELWNLSPDILTVGKAFTNGCATAAATIVTDDVREKSQGIPCYSTFAWLPTDLAVAMANVDVILKEKLWENAKKVGAHLLSMLKALEALEMVEEVRGIGLLLAVEIKNAKSNDRISTIQKACAKEGLIVEIADTALFLSPPLVLTVEEAQKGADILRKVLGAID